MKFSEQQLDTLQQALDEFGWKEQESMAIGECGELLTLYGRRAQGRATHEDWISEIADVMIMMEQMAKMYGYDLVKAAVDSKLIRLQGKIDTYTNNKQAI